MKINNLPEPTLNENYMFSNFKSTMRLVSNVLKLTLHPIRWAQAITSPSQKLPLVRVAGLGVV